MADEKKGTGPKHTPATRATPGKEEAKPKRKMLTDEERIAKLEADLKAAREKAEAKKSEAVKDLRNRRQLEIQRVEERVVKIRALEAELDKHDVNYQVFEITVEDDSPTTVAAAEGERPSTTTAKVQG